MIQSPSGIRAVALDLDGTILDTATDIATAANGMLADLGRPGLEPGQLKGFIGKGVANLVNRTLEESFGAAKDAAMFARAEQRFFEHYTRHLVDTSTPFPGVVEGLDALRAAGLPMACITNKSARFTLPLLERTGLAGYFALVLSGDSLPRKKPDPLPLLHASRELGVLPPELLMVGDSANDAEAARAAGCPVVLMTYGYVGEGAGVGVGADALLDSLLDVTALLRRLHS